MAVSDNDGSTATVRRAPASLLFLSPACLLFAALFALPLGGLVWESFRQFVPGMVGSPPDAPFTLGNYSELAIPSFVGVIFETFRISLLSALVGLVVSLPIAYAIVRRFGRRGRVACIGLLITLVLLSMLVRTYALELTFGSVGVVRPVLLMLGISPNSRWYIDMLVGAGLVHAIIPICTLTLMGAIQNTDPRLIDAAQSLGASRWRAHLTITIPLCAPALVSAYLIALTFSISAFVIPMVLGKGRVLFLSNVIYTRFSDVANYPSGAAISIVMLIVSLIVVQSIAQLQKRRRSTP
jgi:putative spermidine/putrescine transport system permease protein